MSRPTIGQRRVPAAAGVAVKTDRRFHRSGMRPERRRIWRSFARMLKWAACVALVVGGGAWLADIVLHARMLEVHDIRVRGNVRLSDGEVHSLVDGLRGKNIFTVDFETYRRRVLDSPWVSSVALSRVLPSTIDVRIVERTPMAIARVGQQLFLVDDTGVIIDAHSSDYPDLDLPIVDGLVASPGAAGPLVDRDRITVTASFLAALDTRPDLSRRLSQVNVANAHDVVVMFDHDPVWLHLGDSDFIERLNTYLELAPTLGERFAEMDYVDLRFGERIFVRPRGRTDRVALR
jgi:cell division protein FtsQ